MKGHESKMARMEDILNLPVQDPPCAEFSAAHITWVKVEGGRQGGDDIALIPFSRVDDFVKGESSNAECPASFRIESRRKRSEGSISKPRVDGYLEYTLYWCSYGPEDYRDCESGLGDGSNFKPATGKGSRPGRRHMMRGCLCHFTVKRLYTRPLLALIIYNQRKHVDKTGSPCHGILDQDAVGTRAMYAPRISEELRQKVMSMLYVGISLDNIIQHHMEVVQGHGGPHNRDDFLTRNDVRNIERVIRNTSHELHIDDACSVKIWVQRHQKHVFYFQDASASEPFILGIQTDWQLQQMLRHGQNGSVASHSTFGSKKLKYPLSTLLVFDSSRNAIPVAWVITSSLTGQDNHKWVGSLAERLRTKDSRWRLNAFLVDDPSFGFSAIRDAFQCRVLLCVWHVRRAWIRSLLKTCCNIDVQREMFKHLGWILYSSRSVPNAMDAVQEFMEVFVDQSAFMDYFKSQWSPYIESWVSCIRSLPVAGPEPHAAIESYHRRLKYKLFNDQYANFWPRIDWLIHTLTTEFHSLYWLDQYIVETGYFSNLRDESFSTNAWYQALHIPDIDVILDEQNLQVAKVISQTDRNLAYTIWNPGSEFSLCDCHWSNLGNLCKHVIKVAMMCKNRQVAWQDGVLGTNCPIHPKKNFTYRFQVKDQIGSFFYFPSLNFQRASGGFGPIIINNRNIIAIPFAHPDADIVLLVGDWYTKNHTALRTILESGEELGMPDGVLINGKGPYRYNSTLVPNGIEYETINVDPGKTYRFRVNNVGTSTSLNFRIEGHNLLLVETEGFYTTQQNFTSFDIHVGQSYSFLVTMDQNATKDYYIVASARFVNETVWERVTGVAILHYSNSKGPASGPLPVAPSDIYNQWSAMNQPRAIRQNTTASGARPNPQGSFHYGSINVTDTYVIQSLPPVRIDGKFRATLNGISFVNPDTPIRLADLHKVKGAYKLDFPNKPHDRTPHMDRSVINATYKGFIEIILQNNDTKMQSFHMDGYAFFVVGMDFGVWSENSRNNYNKWDAISRSTTEVYPGGWTAVLVSLDNVGVWNLRVENLDRWYLGQETYMRIINPEENGKTEMVPPDNVIYCGALQSLQKESQSSSAMALHCGNFKLFLTLVITILALYFDF